MSDYWRARTVVDWCVAVVELPDRLGLDRFSVLGVSGGGPYALGLGCLVPRRLDTLTIVSSRALGYRGGMPGIAAALAVLAFVSERLPGAVLASMARRARRDPEAFVDRLDRRLRLPARDAGVGAIAYDDLQESLASGSRGTGADLRRSRHWGFRPEEVLHPVRLWHGEGDRQVPVAAARTLAGRLPSVRATFAPGEGHLDVLPCHADEILDGA
jgi:pimeloyl-ACP methyl ester carboxylesterase